MTHPIHRPYNAHEAALMLTLRESHRGRANGISACQLAHQTRQSERDLRSTIEGLRDLGVPILGMPSTGYFLGETEDEITEFCNWLKSRAMKSLVLIARIKKIAVPVLLGQLSLDVDIPPNTQPNNPITQFINQQLRTTL